MEPSTFPFRVSERTRQFLADLMVAMSNSNARFSAASGRMYVQFLEKGQEPKDIDAAVIFTGEGIQLILPMNGVARTNSKSMAWLKKYQGFINQSRGNLVPVSDRCNVLVEATVNGQIKYYFTYMVAHEDGSMAQDMPQGHLYATEGLHTPARQPAQPASQAPAEPAEAAEWMN
jgi:hypothetical protein